MGALDTAALLIEKGNIWVGDDSGSVVDLGAVRNVVFMADKIGTRIESDNRGTIINKARMQGKVSFDWLEPGNAAKIATIFKGLVTPGTVAGSIVNNYSQVVASGEWAYNTFIPFDFNDADGTAPNIDSVTLGTDGAIVVNVDYHVQQHADGRWGIVIVDSATVTTLTQTVTIQFDYTPAASQTLTGGTSQTATNRYVKIIGPSEDSDSVTREIVLEEAIATSAINLQFLDVEAANDVGVMPVTFESNKGTTWTYTDEVNPS